MSFIADVQVYAAPEIETDFHRRTIFMNGDKNGLNCSCHVAIATLVKNEYATMIQAGKNIHLHDGLNTAHSPAGEQAFLDLAILDAKLDTAASKDLAESVRKIRHKYEVELTNSIQLKNLREAGATLAALSQLTTWQVEILAAQPILNLVNSDTLTFAELFDLTAEEYEIFLTDGNILELLEQRLASLSELLKLYRAEEDLFDEVMQYDLAAIMYKHKLTFGKIVALFEEDPIHLDYLEDEDNLPELLLQEAPNLNSVLMEYLRKDFLAWSEQKEIILQVKNKLDEDDWLAFKANLINHYKENPQISASEERLHTLKVDIKAELAQLSKQEDKINKGQSTVSTNGQCLFGKSVAGVVENSTAVEAENQSSSKLRMR